MFLSFCNKNIKVFYFYFKKYILIIMGIIIAFFLLLVPLISIFYEAFIQGIDVFIKNINNHEVKHSIILTMIIALITVPVNLIFGILFSWLLTNFNFIGKNILLTVINLPFAISPVVIGLMYLLTYGIDSPIGNLLDKYNIQIIFSLPSMVLVTIFVTCPFIIMEIMPVMVNYGNKEEEAAIILGASPWKIFYYVTFPKIKLPLLYGVLLTNSRAIGEFGAVSVVSGLIKGETYTLPLQIELLYQDYNSVGAFAASSLLTIIAVILLFLKNKIKNKLDNQFIKI